MDRCVLDTSVIVKSIFKPLKSLSDEVYKREMETHENCRFIIKKIEEDDIDIYIPKVCVVETAAVVKRLANKNLAIRISKSILVHMKLLMRCLFSTQHGRLQKILVVLDLIHIL